MTKFIIITNLLLLTVLSPLKAQIAAVEVDEGSQENQVEDIIVVFKMHFDIGYTDWAEQILYRYSHQMMSETLSEINKTYALPKEEQFIWTIPGWPLKYIRENVPSHLKGDLNRALKEGRIRPHAFPFTVETENSDLETLVRGFSYSDEIRREFGMPLARDAKMTDVPSHSFVIPTLLANAGVDFLHIGCNSGSKSPEIPVLSYWQGPDGKRILLLNWAEYYGSGILPPKNWPHKTWLAMIHTHENTGGPLATDVAKILKEAKEKMPNARIRIGELKDFYDCLMKENPELPIIKTDMPDSWIHGYMSTPRATAINRNMHRLTYAAEALGCQLNLWGIPQQESSNLFASAVENMLLYDEHTFGIAMTHGDMQHWAYGDRFQINKSLGQYDYGETSWNEKQERAEKAERIIRPVFRAELRDIASNVAFNGKRLIVYNPSPWERSDRVTSALGIYRKGFPIYALRDLSTQEIIPVYNVNNIISFDASSVPAFGYKTYEILTDPQTFTQSGIVINKSKHTIENAYFRLQLNPRTGAIASLIDKITDKQLVDKQSDREFAGVYHQIHGKNDLDRYALEYARQSERCWAEWEFGRSFADNVKSIESVGKIEKIVYEPMNNGVRISVIGKTVATDIEYIMNYTLYSMQPYVEVTFGINSKRPDARPESLWLSFPFAIDKPQYKVLRLGGIVDPNKDFAPGTNHHYYFTNGSLALIDAQGQGVALDNPESPAISIDSIGMYRYGDHMVKTGLVYVNLYNNQWGTNFTEWMEGALHTTLRIRSIAEYNPAHSLTIPAEEARLPLQLAYADQGPGTLPISMHGLTISKPGVYVTAFAPQQNGTLLRVWDQTGKSQEVTVTLPQNSNFVEAQPCNLRGIPEGAPIKLEANQFKFAVGANAPLTFILR